MEDAAEGCEEEAAEAAGLCMGPTDCGGIGPEEDEDAAEMG